VPYNVIEAIKYFPDILRGVKVKANTFDLPLKTNPVKPLEYSTRTRLRRCARPPWTSRDTALPGRVALRGAVECENFL